MSEAAASAGPPKADPEILELRTRPRPVRRFNRRVLIGLSALGCALLFAATLLALNPPGLRRGNGQELYNTDRKAKAEGLAELPRSYADMAKATPVLGPPLGGDIGRPVVETERRLGIVSAQAPSPDLSLRPDPEADRLRAERIRLAQKAQQAHEAGVFFQTTGRRDVAQAQTPPGTVPAGPTATPTGAASLRPDPTGLRIDLDRDQNLQQRKLDFLNQGVDRNIYNPHALQDPVSPFQVMAGSVIAASLVTGINSDLPGLVVAQVTENIYDTVSGRTLLIPQGSRLIGSYDSVVAFHQSRALVVWQRIVMPNGSSEVIDNLPATDTAGYAGLEDEVDYHTWQLIKGIALSTLLGIGSEIGYTSNSTSRQSDLVRALQESTLLSTNRAGQRITEKNLNIQPTITIRPGWPVRVIVHKDLVLRAYQG
jgi:type IV secretion system protein TrbI